MKPILSLLIDSVNKIFENWFWGEIISVIIICYVFYHFAYMLLIYFSLKFVEIFFGLFKHKKNVYQDLSYNFYKILHFLQNASFFKFISKQRTICEEQNQPSKDNKQEQESLDLVKMLKEKNELKIGKSNLIEKLVDQQNKINECLAETKENEQKLIQKESLDLVSKIINERNQLQESILIDQLEDQQYLLTKFIADKKKSLKIKKQAPVATDKILELNAKLFMVPKNHNNSFI